MSSGFYDFRRKYLIDRENTRIRLRYPTQSYIITSLIIDNFDKL